MSCAHWDGSTGTDTAGDRIVSYFKEALKGIANHGWKYSADSSVHKNGEYAKAPIALVEVQGYVYQAKIVLADLFLTLPEDTEYDWLSLADRLTAEATEPSSAVA